MIRCTHACHGSRGDLYRWSVPVETDAGVEAWIDLIGGRTISTRARL